jgi:hypothetical protein
MAIYTYKRHWNGSTTTTYFWNTDTHIASTNGTFSHLSELLYPDNTIVDVYQSGTQVKVIAFNSTVNGSSVPSTSYPRLYLTETIVVGSTGDTQNTLLFKRCNSGDSPPTFEFGVYSHITKDVTIFSYPLSSAPFCSAYSISEDTIIQQSCIGTTLRRVYYDGEDGVTIDDTVNSEICGYVAPVPDVVVTEVKRVKIDHSCYNSPVFLRWKNTLGGWDHWLFFNTQTENLKTESIGDFVHPVSDIASAEGDKESLGYNAGNTMILGANGLSGNQYLAIRDLLYSPVIYKVETTGSKKTVRVKPGTFSSETKDRKHSIEFEIILPDTFTVRS